MLQTDRAATITFIDLKIGKASQRVWKKEKQNNRSSEGMGQFTLFTLKFYKLMWLAFALFDKKYFQNLWPVAHSKLCHLSTFIIDFEFIGKSQSAFKNNSL